MHEAGGDHAFAAQAMIGRRAQPTAADPVNQHANGHSALLSRNQGIDESAAPNVVSENVADDMPTLSFAAAIAASIGG